MADSSIQNTQMDFETYRFSELADKHAERAAKASNDYDTLCRTADKEYADLGRAKNEEIRIHEFILLKQVQLEAVRARISDLQNVLVQLSEEQRQAETSLQDAQSAYTVKKDQVVDLEARHSVSSGELWNLMDLRRLAEVRVELLRALSRMQEKSKDRSSQSEGVLQDSEQCRDESFPSELAD